MFKEFYSGNLHDASSKYLFVGLDHHHALVPWIWTAITFNLTAMVLLVLPVSRSLKWLNLTCVLCIVGIWIEKGMGLVIPGFIPTPLGEMMEYRPFPQRDAGLLWHLGLRTALLHGVSPHVGAHSPGAVVQGERRRSAPIHYPRRRRRPAGRLTAAPMAKTLTADDARQSLSAHVAARGAEIFEKYGPAIGWNQLLRILEDRACVRYPCQIAFDAAPLQPGECAWPRANGAKPEDGFVLHIHPVFMTQMDRVARLALYQLVVVNYGEFATSEDAEIFGAAALGISRDQYYQSLCELAELLQGQ